jgi:hypothetical protein
MAECDRPGRKFLHESAVGAMPAEAGGLRYGGAKNPSFNLLLPINYHRDVGRPLCLLHILPVKHILESG